MKLEFFAKTAAVLLLGAFSPMAQADEESPVTCAAEAAPRAELAPWAAPSPLVSGDSPHHLPMLTVGRAAEVTLLQTPRVHYSLRPEKPGGSISYGGLIGLEVAQAGTYRVALGSGAWVDLVRQGKAMVSVAHGHGPACTGVHKMVDFALTPGRYVLQIGANGAPQARVLVARVP